MLNRSQIKFLLTASCAQQSNPNNVFSHMPKEIIHRIKYSPTPDPDFLAALKDAAYAQLDPLRTRLEKAKNNKDNPTALSNLLLQAGDVMTPAGLLIQGTTLLECAICAGDPEMAAMIKSYFFAFKDGEDEMIIQLECCQSAIDEMEKQKPDDLTELINIVINSNPQDVLEELKTGENYNKDHTSSLRIALNQFREDKLSGKNRLISKRRLHCNYQNLIHAYETLDANWHKLAMNGFYGKIDLFAKQIIGFIHLTELTAFYRQLFAQGNTQLTLRSFDYCNSNGSFPDFNQSLINRHSGVGFDSFISIYGRYESEALFGSIGWNVKEHFKKLCETTISNLKDLCKIPKMTKPTCLSLKK